MEYEISVPEILEISQNKVKNADNVNSIPAPSYCFSGCCVCMYKKYADIHTKNNIPDIIPIFKPFKIESRKLFGLLITTTINIPTKIKPVNSIFELSGVLSI